MTEERRKKLQADAKGGFHRPAMPAPKTYKDRKRETKKYACRGDINGQ